MSGLNLDGAASGDQPGPALNLRVLGADPLGAIDQLLADQVLVVIQDDLWVLVARHYVNQLCNQKQPLLGSTAAKGMNGVNCCAGWSLFE